jgi:uncharacterized protein
MLRPLAGEVVDRRQYYGSERRCNLHPGDGCRERTDQMKAAAHSREPVSMRDKVAYLSRPDSYRPSVDKVEIKETHMSWVFLAGDRVYKMKKPVRYPYLDFRTLAAREINCRAEIRLNRRLAPDVYRGVARLTLDPSGTLALDGEGETVDWLVVMRRLPEDRMLDRLIARGAVQRRGIEWVADILARFYRRLEPAAIPPDEHIALFIEQHRINRELLSEPEFGVTGPVLDNVLAGIDGFLEGEGSLITERVRAGRIVEGHGDLRPEHVFLCSPPLIIDCLEFSRRLRLLDPFDELADLALECGRMGAPWIGDILFDRCAQELEDRPPMRLVAFYTAYRACLRARLAIRHLLDSQVREPHKWPPLAQAYLEIADRACVSFQSPAGPRANRSRGSAE